MNLKKIIIFSLYLFISLSSFFLQSAHSKNYFLRYDRESNQQSVHMKNQHLRALDQMVYHTHKNQKTIEAAWGARGERYFNEFYNNQQRSQERFNKRKLKNIKAQMERLKGDDDSYRLALEVSDSIFFNDEQELEKNLLELLVVENDEKHDRGQLIELEDFEINRYVKLLFMKSDIEFLKKVESLQKVEEFFREGIEEYQINSLYFEKKAIDDSVEAKKSFFEKLSNLNSRQTLFGFIISYTSGQARILPHYYRSKQLIYRKDENPELFRKLALQIKQTERSFNEPSISTKILSGCFNRASFQEIGLPNIEPSYFQEPSCSQGRVITKIVVIVCSSDSQRQEQIEVINFPEDDKIFYRMEVVDRNYVSRTPSFNYSSVAPSDPLGLSSFSNNDNQTAYTDNDDLEKSHRS